MSVACYVQEMKIMLANLFNYNETIIEEFLQRYVQNGLIEPKYLTDSHSIVYELTEKGEFLLNHSFKDVNWLYFICLDTPLSFEYLENSKCVSIHLKHWQDYTENAVKTTLTMIRHIKSEALREKRSLQDAFTRDASNSRLCKMFGEQGEFDFTRIIAEMSSMITKLSDQRKTEIIKDIQGL